ncbi:tRNA (adenosine(37)-N6)-threonylcarbamoyltransferase complex dimerization subunit type 1 TsaB [Bacillus salitolerans]|uniref:tRNA (Adenosine(37)-N6)-threonylcarbamoyltransferase complex dimerization subunit type 1 TsaB n=1 Tax=Bacillus salitolerans TaxID=1437434 RepID=A0ABW4LT07_9BACI
MNILSIDTSSYVMGVAIMRDGQIVGEILTNTKKNHSIRLMPAIDSLMKECDVSPKMLHKIVVAKGPGSYTGVRIGVTVAKTLAWTLNIPIVSVSSLEQLAWNGKNFDGYICPLIDARRQHLFTGLYEYKNGSMEAIIEDQNIQIDEWVLKLIELDKNVLFIGNDVPIHQETLHQKLGNQTVFAEKLDWNPKPSMLAFIGAMRDPEHTHSFVPSYLRLAEAEANWLASKETSK